MERPGDGFLILGNGKKKFGKISFSMELNSFLNQELATLSNEAKRRHPNIKSQCEVALAALKEPQPQEMKEYSVDICTPLVTALQTPLAHVALPALHRLVSHSLFPAALVPHIQLPTTLPPPVSSGFFGSSVPTANNTLKVLQILLPLLSNYQIHGELLNELLVLGLKMEFGHAIVRQMVMYIFERASKEAEGPDPRIPLDDYRYKGFRDRYITIQHNLEELTPNELDAYLIVQDLFLLLSSSPMFLSVEYMNKSFALDLIYAVLDGYPQLFYEKFKDVIKMDLIRTVSELHEMSERIRLIRVVYVILREFWQHLPLECEVFMNLLLELIQSGYVHLSLEVISRLNVQMLVEYEVMGDLLERLLKLEFDKVEYGQSILDGGNEVDGYLGYLVIHLAICLLDGISANALDTTQPITSPIALKQSSNLSLIEISPFEAELFEILKHLLTKSDLIDFDFYHLFIRSFQNIIIYIGLHEIGFLEKYIRLLVEFTLMNKNKLQLNLKAIKNIALGLNSTLKEAHWRLILSVLIELECDCEQLQALGNEVVTSVLVELVYFQLGLSQQEFLVMKLSGLVNDMYSIRVLKQMNPVKFYERLKHLLMLNSYFPEIKYQLLDVVLDHIDLDLLLELVNIDNLVSIEPDNSGLVQRQAIDLNVSLIVQQQLHINKLILEAIYKYLQEEDLESSRVSVVLDILTVPIQESKQEKYNALNKLSLIRLGFPCVQLLVDSCKIPKLIKTVGIYAQQQDLNISLSCIGLLWQLYPSFDGVLDELIGLMTSDMRDEMRNTCIQTLFRIIKHKEELAKLVKVADKINTNDGKVLMLNGFSQILTSLDIGQELLERVVRIFFKEFVEHQDLVSLSLKCINKISDYNLVFNLILEYAFQLKSNYAEFIGLYQNIRTHIDVNSIVNRLDDYYKMLLFLIERNPNDTKFQGRVLECLLQDDYNVNLVVKFAIKIISKAIIPNNCYSEYILLINYTASTIVKSLNKTLTSEQPKPENAPDYIDVSLGLLDYISKLSGISVLEELTIIELLQTLTQFIRLKYSSNILSFEKSVLLWKTSCNVFIILSTQLVKHGSLSADMWNALIDGLEALFHLVYPSIYSSYTLKKLDEDEEFMLRFVEYYVNSVLVGAPVNIMERAFKLLLAKSRLQTEAPSVIITEGKLPAVFTKLNQYIIELMFEIASKRIKTSDPKVSEVMQQLIVPLLLEETYERLEKDETFILDHLLFMELDKYIELKPRSESHVSVGGETESDMFVLAKDFPELMHLFYVYPLLVKMAEHDDFKVREKVMKAFGLLGRVFRK